MDIIIELLGTAGYPASFVAASIFFIFLFHKQIKSAQETLNQDYQRVSEDNRKLREELETKDDENRDLSERLWKAETELKWSRQSKGEE